MALAVWLQQTTLLIPLQWTVLRFCREAQPLLQIVAAGSGVVIATGHNWKKMIQQLTSANVNERRRYFVDKDLNNEISHRLGNHSVRKLYAVHHPAAPMISAFFPPKWRFYKWDQTHPNRFLTCYRCSRGRPDHRQREKGWCYLNSNTTQFYDVGAYTLQQVESPIQPAEYCRWSERKIKWSRHQPSPTGRSYLFRDGQICVYQDGTLRRKFKKRHQQQPGPIYENCDGTLMICGNHIYSL